MSQSPRDFLKGEFDFLHKGILLASGLDFHDDIGDGGELVRADCHAHVGKFHFQAADPHAQAGGGLGDFSAAGKFLRAMFRHVDVELDVGAETAGEIFRARGDNKRIFAGLE